MVVIWQAVKRVSSSSDIHLYALCYAYIKVLRANKHNLEQQVHYIIDVCVYQSDVFQGDRAHCWLAHLVELCYTESRWKLPDEIDAPGSSKDIFL